MMFVNKTTEAPLVTLEGKPEIGLGSGCAFLELSAYYVEFLRRLRESSSVSSSRFPTFLVYLAGGCIYIYVHIPVCISVTEFSFFSFTGPYVGVAGAAFLDVPVCEPLTPVMPLFFLPHNKCMMAEVARALKSLKVAIADLESFYDDLTKNPPSGLQQLTFPYVNTVVVNGDAVTLTYLEQMIPDRPLFRAQLGGRDVVVKFSHTYSEECHAACFAQGFAPELISCERIAGGWYVVVMEWLEEYKTLSSLKNDSAVSSSVLAELRRAVETMHGEGFVHGDLRSPNVLVGPGGKVKIIDYDWAGRDGEAVYLPFRNRQNINWHPDAKLGEPIRPDHDIFLLKSESVWPE